jgi:protein involved in polysaccharide export with SLBB domain
MDIDLPGALRDSTSKQNVILQPGDEITIPEFEPSVRVAGAVNSPGSVLWQKGKDLEYYINAAGGYAPQAEKGHVSVRYANGEVRTRHRTIFGSSDPKPGPGSDVTVPTKDPTQHTDYTALFGAIAQILASTVAIIAIATKL